MNVNKRLQSVKKILRKVSGASLTEYAVILCIVSIAAVLVLRGIGDHTNTMVGSINNGFGP
jgi:Flp pilus assembly pilin Flp